MEERFLYLIEKYCDRVKKDIIGCGLPVSDEERLDEEVEKIVKYLFDEKIGMNENDDYERKFKKAVVFNEMVNMMAKKLSRRILYEKIPVELENRYGMRD